ncbi:hypothetical protein EG856_00940 [Mycoplasmopsis phocirhinis]|uniref:Uncharacterized protein n=1 Tax=Mycoplasmopsis phocirhinis TaxID=142650 RepID=A0A4P6MLL0_9BACT|nr:NfeD family protein [Mycoplasmopsis phocirhinis]QBF34495.1 hypothetical protein EG856_00940 [Mycoplasmopsis phocirhinis]
MSDNIIRYVMLGLFCAIFITFILVELFTTSIWSGLTSVAVIPSIFTSYFIKQLVVNISISIVIFIGFWIILYFGSYKFIKKKLLSKIKNNHEYVLENKSITLLSDISEETKNGIFGQAKVGDVFYRTLSLKGEGDIAREEKVIIAKIESNILYVKRKDK